jgi:two-component system sensor histidine kinase KdpD
VRNSLPAGPGGAPQDEPVQALLPQLGHELRTPIQVIAGFVELMLAEQAGPLAPEQRRYLEQIRRSCERLARFAAELSAGDAAAISPVRPEFASLRRLADNVAAAMKPLLELRRQTLRVHIAPGAEQGRFDPARVEQVLQNLVANASEYGPEGGAIDLEAESGAGPTGAELRVSVSDDGPGMLAGRRQASARPGRGLGLAICRAIVSAHGGRLASEEAPGRGTRVCFTLPQPPERSS